MSLALLIDFGSTYTKISVADLEKYELAGYAQSCTTVQTDIMIGLRRAFELLPASLREASFACKLSSSSAAGGLGMVTIGLIPELSAEAARRSALGAGAKVLKVFSFKITGREVREIEEARPDIILLAGGIDGGNAEVIAANARKLAESSLSCPMVVAGNKAAADEVEGILRAGKKVPLVTENVMPDVNVLNVEPARATIRQVFIEKIVAAKGLKRAEEFVEGILMPTPTAVLKAAQLLAEGAGSEPGIGDLAVVDIGGATTDVHSIGWGHPVQAGVVRKGLPEPYAKRTVEGDLGIRYNAGSILKLCGAEAIRENAAFPHPALGEKLECLARDVGFVPGSPEDRDIDFALASCAARAAMERHAGTIEALWGPHGQYFIQYGKDLTPVEQVIGTGGVFVHNPRGADILKKTLFSPEQPFSLRPGKPRLYTDASYCLFAVGLLAERYPEAALRVGKKYLKKWDD